MIKKSLLFGAVALAAVAPMTAQEAETEAVAVNPAVQAVVKHVSTLLDSSWKSTFAIEAFEGEKKAMDMTFAVKFMDLKHFRMEIVMNTEDEFEGTVKQTFTVVNDGSYLYLDSPDMAKLSGGMMSGPVKVEWGLLEKMIAAESGVDINDGGALKGMLSEAISGLNLKEDGSAEGKRRFVIKEEGASGFMIFDAETWFLESAEIKAEEGHTKITTSDTGKVKEWPEGTFTFTPAEGVVVTDLTSMLQMQMGPMDAGDEEDLEF